MGCVNCESDGVRMLWFRSGDTRMVALSRGLLALALLASVSEARADRACSGGDDVVARPIAYALQAHVSAVNAVGRFEVALGPFAGSTTVVQVRHYLGNKLIFEVAATLQFMPETVVQQRLPSTEGFGFAIRTTEGGSGYGQSCTYGFRFQSGAVAYRTLHATGENRSGPGTFPGEVTAWKQIPAGSDMPVGVASGSLPTLTAGSTPSTFAAGPPDCSTLGGAELSFCRLMLSVEASVVSEVTDQVKGWAFEKGLLLLFRQLPKGTQTALFSPGFLKEEFAVVPFKKVALSYIKAPAAGVLTSMFLSAVKDSYDSWAFATYGNSPFNYALVQGFGDQMYVGLQAMLTTVSTGKPQAGWMQLFIQESLITATHLYATRQSRVELNLERRETIASMAQLIQSSASAAFAQQQGYFPSGTKAVSEDSVAAAIHQVVASSNIADFDQVARLIFEAKMAYFGSAGLSKTLTDQRVKIALALASKLDANQPLVQKYWVTSFSSYDGTARSVLKSLNLLPM